MFMTEGKVKACKYASTLISTYLLLVGLVGTIFFYIFAEDITSLLLSTENSDASKILTKLIYSFCIGCPILTSHTAVLAVARAVNHNTTYLVFTGINHYLLNYTVSLIMIFVFNIDC